MILSEEMQGRFQRIFAFARTVWHFVDFPQSMGKVGRRACHRSWFAFEGYYCDKNDVEWGWEGEKVLSCDIRWKIGARAKSYELRTTAAVVFEGANFCSL